MLTHISPKSQVSVRQNLKWLFILRNLMMLSEVILIILSVYGLGINLPEQQLWLVVLSTGAVNLYTSMRLETDDPVTELEIFTQISIDVFAIAVLLYLTGGASNPITWVFLLPLIITAIMLPQAYAWYMVILTTSLYTMLIAFNIPLPSIEPHMPDPAPLLHSDIENYQMLQHAHIMNDKSYFSLHMFGMWFGFVFSAGLVAFFVVELAKTLRDQERSLAEARENALRDERVIALGTLAASAAHDMGTPLGTIAIVAHELEQEYPSHRYPDLFEKMLIMQQQINRCKEALSVMSASAGEMRAESGGVILLTDYIDDVIKQWRTHKPGVKLNFIIDPNVATEAKIIAERTLTHSIINILNNAAEASPTELGIEFHATWDLDYITIKIRDFGPGFPPELVEFAGKQPVVSKKRGLGVGLFLTYSTINRLGGKINLYNCDSGGACVEITLPLLNTETYNDNPGNG
ncbi:MAG: ATP-binding protein [Methylococcaceae bacterium]|nr:ATP-binding protein [Methylococcaceae bacterium]OYV22565.1 MAG: two-component system, sensor histidine kinase RegB [Methylococcaceae bacterium NSO1]